MFFMDITLFYLIPLVLSVVLYTLIAIMLLFTAPRTFNDGTVRNQARLQVSEDMKIPLFSQRFTWQWRNVQVLEY